MSVAKPQPAKAKSGPELLRLLGLLLILFAALLRASVTHDAMPYWSMDPATVATPLDPGTPDPRGVTGAIRASLSGVGPTGVLLMDLAGLLGAFLALCGLTLGGGRMPLLWPALATLGSLGVLVHALVLKQGDLDHLRIGASWICAVWSCLGVYAACSDPKLRRLAIGLALGFIVVLALRGGVQVFSEHARTVADFERNREAILASRGWTEGSASALVYERRLRQPEALGWFGLSNVYASFAATASVVFIGLAVPLIALARKDRSVILGAAIVGLVALLSVVALLYNDSKGGFAAAAFGLSILALAWLAARPLRATVQGALLSVLRYAGVLAITLPLLALVLRGLIGERVGELSLLFRWFYLVGSVRIFGENPLLGVGPGGFQDAYADARPPLSPEEVTSPHSVLFDWGATLGLFGVAWCALLVLVALRAGRNAANTITETEAEPRPAPPSLLDAPRARIYSLALVIAGVLAVSMWLERGSSFAATIAMAFSDAEPMPIWALGAGLGLVTIAGVLWGACVTTLLTSRIGERSISVAGLAGAGVMLAHWQIEMTPTQPSSAPLAFAILAACAAGRPRPTPATPDDAGKKPGRFARLPGLIAAIVPLALVPILWAGGVQRVAAWESGLARAAILVEPIGRVRALASGVDASDRTSVRAFLENLRLEHSALIGAAPPANMAGLERRLLEAELERRPAAHEILTDASESLELRHTATRKLLIEEAIRIAERYRAIGDDQSASAWAARAMAMADAWSAEEPDRFGPAMVKARAIEGTASDPETDPRVREAWERAHRLSPRELAPIRRLWQLALDRNDPEQAALWAERLLDAEARFRLDPLRGLSESERLRARRSLPDP